MNKLIILLVLVTGCAFDLEELQPLDTGFVETDADVDAGMGIPDADLQDAGEILVDSGTRDSAIPGEDSGTFDSGTRDAGTVSGDAGTCTLPTTQWRVGLVSPSVVCNGLLDRADVTITPASECTWDSTFPVSGTISMIDTTMLRASLAVDSGTTVACSGTYDPSAVSINMICGSCVFNLVTRS